MEGTITQLGLKNYLIDKKKPKKSFFSHSYNNFYNYAKDVRKIAFQANVDFGKRVSFRFDQDGRYGDLITNMILELDLPDLTGLATSDGYSVGYTNGVGNALIKTVQLKIGGNIIDTQTGEWMDIWSSLSIPAGKRNAYNNMVKKYPNQSADNFKGGKVYIPFLFWFCQNVNSNTKDNTAMCLPLIGMRTSEIELIVEFRPLTELLIYNTTEYDPFVSLPDTTLAGLHILHNNLLVDYVILEPEERVKYLEAKRQMYLITQTQYHTYSIQANSQALSVSMRNFRYPITELLWVIRTDDNTTANDLFNYGDRDYGNPNSKVYYSKAKLTFDGRDRIPELDSEYFTTVEPFKIHDSVPDNNHISTISFALEPENFAQPSGSCNFSGLFDPRFQFTLKSNIPTGEITVFSINYNVLQIDDKGNVWLLHNLSKDTPGELPDPSKSRYISACNLSAKENKRMKHIISKINEFNLFTDPRLIETGLANLVTQYTKQRLPVIDPDNDDLVMPLLDSLYTELSKVGRQIDQLERNGVKIKDKDNRVANIGGRLVNLDDVQGFLEDIVSSPKSDSK